MILKQILQQNNLNKVLLSKKRFLLHSCIIIYKNVNVTNTDIINICTNAVIYKIRIYILKNQTSSGGL